MKVTLIDGLKIGDDIYKEAELREVTAGDMIDATEESERPCITPDGYKLLTSPSAVGVNTLRRQIARIGDHPGPLSLAELKKLSGKDLELLQTTAMLMDGMNMESIGDRGKE